MDRELLHLLSLIKEADRITAEQLAHKLNRSEKTIRTRLKALKTELLDSGATLASKPRIGYRLVIDDAEKFANWSRIAARHAEQRLPETHEERLMHLMEIFISGKFFKLSDESEGLFVSAKTLSQEIQHAESILDRCGLTIERVPNHGMRASGDEFSFRKTIMHCLSHYREGFSDLRLMREQASSIVADILLDVFSSCNVVLSEAALETFVLYLVVASTRCHRGHHIESPTSHCAWQESDKDRRCAHTIIGRMREAGIPTYDGSGEISYMAAFIAGGEIRRDTFGLNENLVIPDEVQRSCDLMLDAIYDMCGIDFSCNLRLRLMLCNHLAAFDIRMRYGIEISNPLLNETRRIYPFAHALAQQAVLALASQYERPVSEDETAYFTVMFQMALDMQRRAPKKSRVLLICATGKSSSQFLAFQFKEAFGDYIDTLNVCSVFELDDMDFSNIDYVFSTVPVEQPIPRPIMEVSSFLEIAERTRIQRRLEFGNSSYLQHFYRPELFFTELSSKKRDEALAELCGLINRVRPLPDGFLNSIIERDERGSTDFGNLAALPHPLGVLPDENLVAVGILKRPIRWKVNDVQLIILTSICDSTNEETQRFYQATAKLLTDQERVRRIIEDGTYETLIHSLCE